MTVASFSVDFGRGGRTIEYRDPIGSVEFSLDAGEGRSLILEHFGPRSQRPPNYDIGFRRAKEFLSTKGYSVEECGNAHLPPLPDDDEVLEALRDLVHQPSRPGLSLLIPPHRAIFKDDTDGSDWSLWVVAKSTVGACRGHRLVFDPISKQFGVVSPTDLFLGFWGSFDQTIDALLERKPRTER